MEYNEVRALVKRWLAGETTLAEEEALRNFFVGAQDGLPVDLQLYRPLFGQSAEAAGEKSRRKLVLHTDIASRSLHRPLRRWSGVAACIAAAVLATVAIVVPKHSYPGDIVCVVNGMIITEPTQIAAYTLEALEIASLNLRKPQQAISSELDGDPVMVRVGEMLNELIKTE